MKHLSNEHAPEPEAAQTGTEILEAVEKAARAQITITEVYQDPERYTEERLGELEEAVEQRASVLEQLQADHPRDDDQGYWVGEVDKKVHEIRQSES